MKVDAGINRRSFNCLKGNISFFCFSTVVDTKILHHVVEEESKETDEKMVRNNLRGGGVT